MGSNIRQPSNKEEKHFSLPCSLSCILKMDGEKTMAENKELNFYRDTIIEILTKISAEIETIRAAAAVVAEVIAREEPVHVIGPGGHSNMAVEEVFWRAGGFAAINAILDPGTNLIHGGARSMMIERTPGYVINVLDAFRVGRKPDEVIIIANAYGVNSLYTTSSRKPSRGR